MEELGFWKQGPAGSPSPELGPADMGKLGGALRGVVMLCCEVAQMEGLDMKTLLERTYET